MSSLAKSVTRISRQKVPRIVGVAYYQRRHDSNLTALKRGTGGRSSFSGIVATVFGSSGYLGKPLIARLGNIGSQVILPYRGDNYQVGMMKGSGDLGQVLFYPLEHCYDMDRLRKSMIHSNVVINLIGREFETRAYDFYDVHLVAARNIARAAKEVGVERLIHFSDVNASPKPQRVLSQKHAEFLMTDIEFARYNKNKDYINFDQGGSHFLKSKYYGELAVRDEFPEATIFKPSTIWGRRNDKFAEFYLHEERTFKGALPIYNKGMSTIKQPVYYRNVIEGVVNALKDPSTAGKNIVAVGPHRYTLHDLVDYVIRMTVKPFTITDFHLKLAHGVGKHINVKIPFIWFDRFERECITDVYSEDDLTLEDIGVELWPIEKRIYYELRHKSGPRYFEDFQSRAYYTVEEAEKQPPLYPHRSLPQESSPKQLQS